MLQNYEYFLALAETENISKAAQKLYISHQCLSRYLKSLEEECGLTLFTRKPTLSLTYAGQVLRDSLRSVQRIEQNTLEAFEELKNGGAGEVRLGMTEGRLRIFLPGLLKEFQQLFPNVNLRAMSASTPKMLDLLAENKLDLVIGGPASRSLPDLKHTLLMDESLYLVVSDHLLQQYLPDKFPACKKTFIKKGADLRLFCDMPFSIAHKGYSSRSLLDDFMQKNNISLNIIYEADQPDMLHILTANDYSASLAFSMYLPSIYSLNQGAPEDNQLNIFPICDLTATKPLYLMTQKDQYHPQYTKDLIRLIQKQCREEYTLKI